MPARWSCLTLPIIEFVVVHQGAVRRLVHLSLQVGERGVCRTAVALLVLKSTDARLGGAHDERGLRWIPADRVASEVISSAGHGALILVRLGNSP